MEALKGVPSDRELNKLAKQIPVCWYSLAIQLGLDIGTVDNIDNIAAYSTPGRKALHALVEWRKNFGNDATYEKLSEALREEGRHDLVQRFCTGQVNQKSDDECELRQDTMKHCSSLPAKPVTHSQPREEHDKRKRAEEPCPAQPDPSVTNPQSHGDQCKRMKTEEPPSEFDLHAVQNRLSEFYKTNMSKVQMAPWDPDDTVPIDEVYTRLSWCREDQKPSGIEEKELEDYADIFLGHKNCENPKRILVHGQSGIGKSTFTQKLAVEWAKQEKEALKKFDLLVVIKLRDVCGDVTDFKEMVRMSGLLPSDKPAALESLHRFICDNQDRILILFDGFDEYDKAEDTHSDVYKIISGQLLRDCHVVVTTREVKVNVVKKFMHTQCKINGFTQADMMTFATKYVGEDQCKAFMSYLWENDIMDMASIPLMLLFLCLLWKERKDQPLPTSRTKLYQEITQCIIDHCCAKVPLPLDSLKNIDECSETLCKIGKVAFKALLEDSLVFDTAVLSKDVQSDDVVRLGFVSISKVQHQRSKVMASFFHKSMQEFLAAWYIANEAIPQGFKDWILPICDFATVQKFKEFLKFVGHLSAEGAKAIFVHLKNIEEKENFVPKTLVREEDLTQDQKKFLVWCFHFWSTLDSKEAVLGAYLDCVRGVVLLERERHGSPPSPFLFHSETSFEDDGFSDDSSSSLPEYPVEECPAEEMPTTHSDSFFSTALDILALLLHHNSLVRVLLPDFFSVSEANDDTDSLFEFFRKIRLDCYERLLPVLGQFDIRVVTGSPDEAHMTGAEFLKHYRFTSLAVCERKFWLVRRESAFYLIYEGDLNQGFNSMYYLKSNLDVLRPLPQDVEDALVAQMSSNQSSSSGGVQSLHVFSLVKECSILYDRVVQSNTHNLIAFLSELRYAVSVQSITFLRAGISSREAPVLAMSLTHLSKLQELKIKGSPFGNAAHILFNHPFLQLYLLNLKRTDMDETGVAALAEVLENLPQLKHLDLSHNFLGPGLSALFKKLSVVPQLVSLKLQETEMGEKEVVKLAEELRSVPHLTCLMLKFNPLGPGVSVLARYLEGVPDLNELHLNDTDMTLKEAREVVKVLQHVPQLEKLGLSCNCLSDGSVSLAEEMVANMPKRLRLNIYHKEYAVLIVNYQECETALKEAAQRSGKRLKVHQFERDAEWNTKEDSDLDDG